MKLKQGLKNNFSSLEGGYTIIESLVAMIMVATLMAAVAPVIAFSAGTRVQARRMELATQAARSYIDAVRLGQLEPPGGFVSETEISASALTQCSPTNSSGNPDYCETPLISATLGEFYCVDNDGGGCTPNSLTDMMVHGAIDLKDVPRGDYKDDIENGDSDTRSKLGYPLQVRVFRAAAFASSVKLSNEGVPFTVNNAGLATRNGDKERPLFETKTEIAPTENSFQNYLKRLPVPSPSPE